MKRLADPAPPEEYIMALNKNGVHFLDIITHVSSLHLNKIYPILIVVELLTNDNNQNYI